VISELRKARKTHQNVRKWAERLPSASLYISVISVLELEIGILLVDRRDKEQGAILRAWMDRHVLPTFSDRILAIDTAVAQQCATLHVPNPRSDRDALIAATALVHGLTVATRNVADFERTGVGVLNPWEA
jgi:predicted nucleic acid-binding protein